jgi:uncharacterized protein (DUF305 family)
MSNTTNGSPEEILRNRFASGEIDAGEYERSLKALKGERSIAKSRSKARLLAVGLAAAALLAVGGGAVYAQGQGSTMMGGEAAKSETDRNGMGRMMNGGMMGGQGGMGSMMGDQGMSGGQMMGSFDEEQPFDLQFIDQMIMHHQGAIMSSEHMISDSERPELRQLAEDIQQSQSEQIEQLQEWREEWYPDTERTFGMMDPTQMEGMMGDGMMEGMMGGSMQEMMGGDATDAMFLRMMIPHHQMAVDMSEEALDGNAEHPELEELAQTIRDEQSAEIELMQVYLDEIEAASGGKGPNMEVGESHHEH